MLKTAVRQFLHNGNMAITLLNSIVIIAIGYGSFNLGRLWESLLPISLASVPELLKTPVSIFVMLLLYDLVGKYFMRKVSFSFLTFKRFPNVKKSLNIIYLLEESISFWNIYLVLMLSRYLYDNVYASFGLFPFVTSLLLILGFQIIISFTATRLQFSFRPMAFLPLAMVLVLSAGLYQLLGVTNGALYLIFLLICATIAYLLRGNLYIVNHNTGEGTKRRKTTKQFSKQSNPYYFTLFNLKMYWRSGFLRKQLIMLLLFSAVYTHLYLNGASVNTGGVVFRFVTLSFIFSMFPILFSPYLISTESAFFHKLMVIPKFNVYFLPKYGLCILFTTLTFIGFCIANEFKSFLEVFALYLYCIGPISLSSFLAILYANKPINLNPASLKNQQVGFTAQNWIVLAGYAVCMLFFAMSYYIAPHTKFYIYFMIFTGILSIALSNRWLNYLVRLFYKTKYKKQISFQK